MIRCERLSPRRQHVDEDEHRYAVGHWPLLAKLRQALRTERNVRLAVVYGSVARGEDTPQSDLDVLLSLASDRIVDIRETRRRRSSGLRVTH